MFDGLTQAFRQHIDTFKKAVDAHERARGLYDQPAGQDDPWADVRMSRFSRTDWHIYDHCAAFTRLYAIYGTYVDELVEEYLRLLPTIYRTYNLLPRAITTQHRVGVSGILGKIGDGSRFAIGEAELSSTFSQGVTGGVPYKLIREAFFTERQNYRLEVLNRLLSSLGITNAAKSLARDPGLRKLLEAVEPGAATVQSELELFIQRRNEAAHSTVDEVVATDEIKRTAEFVAHLGVAIAALFDHAISSRRFALGQLPHLGEIEEIHRGGYVGIGKLSPCVIRVGDRLALGRDNGIIIAVVLEIQRDDESTAELALTAEAEVGIRFDRKVKKGSKLCQLR